MLLGERTDGRILDPCACAESAKAAGAAKARHHRVDRRIPTRETVPRTSARPKQVCRPREAGTEGGKTALSTAGKRRLKRLLAPLAPECDASPRAAMCALRRRRSQTRALQRGAFDATATPSCRRVLCVRAGAGRGRRLEGVCRRCRPRRCRRALRSAAGVSGRASRTRRRSRRAGIGP
eukprot:scaffold90387_cov48-Phaeocystis_antarctica.AAC.1